MSLRPGSARNRRGRLVRASVFGRDASRPWGFHIGSFAAAQRLLRRTGVAAGTGRRHHIRDSEPGYALPGTSHVLHARLGLPDSCYALDISMGCAGYVYGLWAAASFMQTVRGKVLLLVGDTSTRMISPQDKSVALLFGDAGTATALEPSDSETPMLFELGADGSGANSLIIPAGGFRHRLRGNGLADGAGGEVRSDEDLFMDGPAISASRCHGCPTWSNPCWPCRVQARGHRSRDLSPGEQLHAAPPREADQDPGRQVRGGYGELRNSGSALLPLAITTSPLRQRIQASPTRLSLAASA